MLIENNSVQKYNLVWNVGVAVNPAFLFILH